VVTKWSHDVTWKSGCFPAHEKGDFSKNSDVLQLMKMGLFNTYPNPTGDSQEAVCWERGGLLALDCRRLFRSSIFNIDG